MSCGLPENQGSLSTNGSHDSLCLMLSTGSCRANVHNSSLSKQIGAFCVIRLTMILISYPTPPVHIPPDLVVGSITRSSKASRGEDLQVEHPVRCRDAPALHFHPTPACVQGPALIGNQVVQVRHPGEKRRLAPTGMVEPLHGEERAVDGVVRLIQHGAHCWHLGVGEHRIPPRFLGLKPAPHALAMLCAHRRGDVSGTVAYALAQRHHPQACALATPMQRVL